MVMAVVGVKVSDSDEEVVENHRAKNAGAEASKGGCWDCICFEVRYNAIAVAMDNCNNFLGCMLHYCDNLQEVHLSLCSLNHVG